MYDDLIPVLHEGKTTSSYTFREKWGEPGTNMIPREYYIQTQHQMMLTGAKKNIVSVLVFPERPDKFENLGVNVKEIYTEEWADMLAQMGQYTIDANPELQELMLQEYINFWNNHVLKRVPPEPVTFDDIRRLAVEPKETVIADEQIERLAVEYRDITGEMASAKKRKDAIKVQIVKYMIENQQGNIDDDSTQKLILRDSAGHKLGQFDGKVYR
jgi:predicted phage-related endonuclease